MIQFLKFAIFNSVSVDSGPNPDNKPKPDNKSIHGNKTTPGDKNSPKNQGCLKGESRAKKPLYSVVVPNGGTRQVSICDFVADFSMDKLPPDVTWVDTPELLEDFMLALNEVVKTICDLFLDEEGCRGYNRFGELCTLQLRIDSKNHTWVLDVVKLEQATFYTAPVGGLSLKEILESPEFPKVFFDVRMDSDIL